MTVLPCKSQFLRFQLAPRKSHWGWCPSPALISLCKPSVHVSPPSPLKLENTNQVSAVLSSFPDSLEQLSGEKVEIENGGRLDGGVTIGLKSSLKKPSGSSQTGESGVKKNIVKGRVQWLDILGEELVEIKEFESSDLGESEDDDDGNRSCMCVIQ